jgi:hypothetical protein
MRRHPYTDSRHNLYIAFAIAAVVIVMWLIPLRPSFAQGASSRDGERNFSLREGQGVAVCEAYLELLNRTKFKVTPFCGRPDEGPVKGFEHLDGHLMGVAEIWPLFTKVWEFMRFGDQSHVEKFYYPNAFSPELGYYGTDATSKDTLARGWTDGWLSVWAFATPIDINNDGGALNVITWQGYGATGTGSRCGSDYTRGQWNDSYVNQRAFVLTADGKAIDESRSRSIFGAPPGVARREDAQLPGGDVPPQAFRPLADSIGILKYAGRYYIETQDRPEPEDAERPEDAELPSVQVLLREHGKTTRVCSLHPQSAPVPVD